MDYTAKLDEAIQHLHDEGRYRTFIDIERRQGHFPHAVWSAPDGTEKDITVWCGNDYLGMGQHPVVLSAMHEAIDAAGAGSGGTRNISGTTVYHKRLEAELADLHGKEAALLFTSAYIANDATLSTLPKLFPGLIIYSDALNHASMIEGVRRNGGAKRIFRHNDLAHLRALLEADDPAAPKLIAFESIYSMDGDFGPVEAICDGILSVAAGQTVISQAAQAILQSAEGANNLTARELQVLQAIARGMTNQAASEALGISSKTIDSHRTNLMRKLGVRSTASLLVRAMRDGLIDVSDID